MNIVNPRKQARRIARKDRDYAAAQARRDARIGRLKADDSRYAARLADGTTNLHGEDAPEVDDRL